MSQNPAPSRWELQVAAADEAVDWVLLRLATLGFTSEQCRVERAATRPGRRRDLTRWPVTVRCTVPHDTDRHQLRATVTRLLEPLQRLHLLGDFVVQPRPLPDPSAQTATRPLSCGRWCIVPADQPIASEPGARVLRVPSHLSFGTGRHPTTQLSLGLVERYTQAGMQALDLGAGSGILSVALASLGATVLALDNDAQAVTAARATVAANGLQERVTVAAGSLGRGTQLGHWQGGEPAVIEQAAPVGGAFDVIVSNILARVHVALAADYRDALRRDGRLLSAGYTTADEATVTDALTAVGLVAVDRQQVHEYVALVHRRPD